MRTLTAVVSATAVALVLAGCGGSEERSGADNGSTELEKTELTVGVLPLADYAAVYWAEDQGIFNDVGLDVTLKPVSGGPVGIQNTVAGEIDCSFANTIATVVAQSSGIPVQMVVQSSALGDESNIIVVDEDSPIRTLEDLDGATIGVNTTNNIGDVLFNSHIKEKGVDIDVQFVEVPFGEMIDGVKGGSLDATHTPEPFRSAALGAGLRQVADITEGGNQGMPGAAFVCSKQFVQENPNTTAAFAEALYKAGDELNNKEDELRAWLPDVSGVPDEVAQTMKLPNYFSKPEPGELQRLVDLLEQQELLKGKYSVDEHLYQP